MFFGDDGHVDKLVVKDDIEEEHIECLQKMYPMAMIVTEDGKPLAYPNESKITFMLIYKVHSQSKHVHEYRTKAKFFDTKDEMEEYKKRLIHRNTKKLLYADNYSDLKEFEVKNGDPIEIDYEFSYY